MSSRKSFRAPWSGLLKGMSLLTTFVLLSAPVIVMNAASLAGLPLALVSLLPFIILIGCALFTVRGYTIENRQLLIRRLLWNTSIELRGLREVSTEPGQLARSIRLFGNGGAFSFSGVYRNSALGTYRAYLTDFSRAVILKFPDRTVVISPDAPDEFASSLQSARP